MTALERLVASTYAPVRIVGGALIVAHTVDVCAGLPCCIHAPSAHHMVTWRQHWRNDRRLMERVCPHGIGHPDPDDRSPDRVHGCDGCCVPPEETR